MMISLVLGLAFGVVQGYINDYDQPINFRCPDNKIIYHLFSVHSNHHEDRVWDILCRSVSFTKNCETSGYVNDFDQPANHVCPGNKVMTGIESYHSNHHEDRKWKFTCCDASNRALSRCYWTGFLNNFDQILAYTSPSGYAIRSMYSYHNNHHEDRRFKVEVCLL